MKLLDKLDRRFGRFAIPHLTQLLIICQVAVMILSFVRPEFLEMLLLRPDRVMAGEVYRVLTFFVVPPSFSAGWMVLAIFYFLIWYMMGTTLEAQWGTFRYNVYVLSGGFAVIAVSFLPLYQQPGIAIPNEFLNGTVFLAFAVLYPDFEFRLFFILPVKVKYLAMFQGVLYVAQVVFGDMAVRLIVLTSLSNFFVFFGPMFFQSLRSHRRKQAWKAKSRMQSNTPRHTCTVCGINSMTHPDVEFRYCTQCDGDYGYCMEHLRDHEHISAKAEVDGS